MGSCCEEEASHVVYLVLRNYTSVMMPRVYQEHGQHRSLLSLYQPGVLLRANGYNFTGVNGLWPGFTCFVNY